MNKYMKFWQSEGESLWNEFVSDNFTDTFDYFDYYPKKQQELFVYICENNVPKPSIPILRIEDNFTLKDIFDTMANTLGYHAMYNLYEKEVEQANSKIALKNYQTLAEELKQKGFIAFAEGLEDLQYDGTNYDVVVMNILEELKTNV